MPDKVFGTVQVGNSEIKPIDASALPLLTITIKELAELCVTWGVDVKITLKGKEE